LYDMSSKPLRTIMVVDDNDAFRGMLSTVLAERGYQVIVAVNGDEALGVLATDHPLDAVIADVNMPGMDGFEFCRRLRAEAQPQHRDVPVWIMTGALQLGLTKKGNAVGAVLVLRKPFNVDEVCAQFEQAFEARGK
jgi:CheY-like chemotaxis protein